MADNNIYLEIKQDEDKDITLQWFEGDGVTPDPFSTPVTAEAEIKSDVTATAYHCRLSSADGTITITAATGVIVLNFTQALTTDLDFDSAYIDIVINETVDGAIRRTRDLRGTVHLIRKVTTAA